MDQLTRQRLLAIFNAFDEGSATGPAGSWVSTPLDSDCLALWSEVMAGLDGAMTPEEVVTRFRTKVRSIRESSG